MPITLQPREERRLDIQLTPIAEETARLYGYVIDAEANAPVAGAKVEISGVYYYSAITDIAGYYNITDIVAGTYDGLVTAAGYYDFPF